MTDLQAVEIIGGLAIAWLVFLIWTQGSDTGKLERRVKALEEAIGRL